MDEAVTRRFQSMVQFTIPGTQERLPLWQNAFNGVCELAGDVNLPAIADRYEVLGGQIINVLRQCALTAIQRNVRTVTQDDIIANIRQEFRKDNKMFFE